MSNSNNGHTTTQELIVSYLDGELVRKELETVLFERLASSENARLLLREYLTMRGAIHASRKDERFALMPLIDARTKGRIEIMLKNVPALETSSIIESGFAMDKPPLRTLATDRSLKLWSKRVVPALALLLLTIGTTWYITRTTVQSQNVALNTATAPTSASSAITSTTSQPQNTSAQEPKRSAPAEHIRIVKEYIPVAEPTQAIPSTDMAQNGAAAQQTTTTPTPATETNDPKDIMISHRYAKLIRETPAIAITQQDRL